MEKEEIFYRDSSLLDKKDLDILKLLQEDARISIADISRKTGIQRDSVIYRIKKMQKEKIIKSFQTMVDFKSMGFALSGILSVTLYNHNHEKEKSFIDFLEKHQNITEIKRISGKWDFNITMISKSLEDLNKIISQIRIKFSEIIKEYEASPIIQEYKSEIRLEK